MLVQMLWVLVWMIWIWNENVSELFVCFSLLSCVLKVVALVYSHDVNIYSGSVPQQLSFSIWLRRKVRRLLANVPYVRKSKLIATIFQSGAPARSIIIVSPQMLASLIIALFLKLDFAREKIFKTETWNSNLSAHSLNIKWYHNHTSPHICTPARPAPQNC